MQFGLSIRYIFLRQLIFFDKFVRNVLFLDIFKTPGCFLLPKSIFMEYTSF